MPHPAIALSLPCRFSLAQRRDGHLQPVSDDDHWGDAHVVALRETDHTDPSSPIIVAVIRQAAQPIPFHPDYDAGIMSTPIGDYDLKEFRSSFLRCDQEGNVVGTFLDPCWIQMRDAIRADSEAHKADIAGLVASRRRGERVADQVDWRLYDIAMSDETDGLSAADALARARVANDAPVHLVHGLEGLVSLQSHPHQNGSEAHSVKMVLEGWQEIRVFPQYLIAAMRALFIRFLGDRIGSTPIEEIVRLHLAPGEMDDMCEVFLQEGFEEDAPSPPFKDEHMMQGGYETSIVRNFRGNGADVIVFQDFNGSYSYAWPQACLA
ncbi:hypothetical protein G6L37_04305 [Agrobacterium rubi]|nr:hypothetical protein [Agrobacterium rubi]NTF24574.1 hypothetical protein [Agrobacterium rubi]